MKKYNILFFVGVLFALITMGLGIYGFVNPGDNKINYLSFITLTVSLLCYVWLTLKKNNVLR